MNATTANVSTPYRPLHGNLVVADCVEPRPESTEYPIPSLRIPPKLAGWRQGESMRMRKPQRSEDDESPKAGVQSGSTAGFSDDAEFPGHHEI
jgi:hypothetical protein